MDTTTGSDGPSSVRPEHSDGGQPVDQPAGYQLQQLEQHEQHPEYDVQRERARIDAAAECYITQFYGGWDRQLFDRLWWLSVEFADWNQRRELCPGRTVRTSKAGKDSE